ncbi:MAG: alpha/beta hydrolase fold domain-containing protein [Chlamydiia bacterium]|nr:alpha/beta hydrolase fold domain-containing protein [Chlamydiia bacterium]
MVSKEYDPVYKEALKLAMAENSPLEEIRLQFERAMSAFPPDPEVRFDSFSIGDLPALWTFAPNVTRSRILLFFHGDSYTRGSMESHKNLMGRLSAAAGGAVMAIQYRLAPEHPYPAALDDALSAYRFLLHHPYARSRIIFAGIAAGAGLALSLLLRLKQEQIATPACALCLSPWVDLSLSLIKKEKPEKPDIILPSSLAAAAKQYAAGERLTSPLLSPLFGDLTGLPPLFIQTGSNDLLHPEALALHLNAKKAKVTTTCDICPQMMHMFQMFAPGFPESQQAIERAGAFVHALYTKNLSK